MNRTLQIQTINLGRLSIIAFLRKTTTDGERLVSGSSLFKLSCIYICLGPSVSSFPIASLRFFSFHILFHSATNCSFAVHSLPRGCSSCRLLSTKRIQWGCYYYSRHFVLPAHQCYRSGMRSVLCLKTMNSYHDS